MLLPGLHIRFLNLCHFQSTHLERIPVEVAPTNSYPLVAQYFAGYLDQQVVFDRNAFANSEDRQFLSTFLDNNNAVIPLKVGLGATLFLRPTDWLELALGTADADNEPRQAEAPTASTRRSR